jgi:hypothetical protein
MAERNRSTDDLIGVAPWQVGEGMPASYNLRGPHGDHLVVEQQHQQQEEEEEEEEDRARGPALSDLMQYHYPRDRVLLAESASISYPPRPMMQHDDPGSLAPHPPFQIGAPAYSHVASTAAGLMPGALLQHEQYAAAPPQSRPATILGYGTTDGLVLPSGITTSAWSQIGGNLMSTGLAVASASATTPRSMAAKPKEQKRRTKTGCLTCRKRRIKVSESVPQCCCRLSFWNVAGRVLHCTVHTARTWSTRLPSRVHAAPYSAL